MLKLTRGNNTDYKQFYLSNSQFIVELTRTGSYDLTPYFTSSAKLNVTIYNNSGASCTFQTTSKETVAMPPIITIAKYSITNLVGADTLPYSADLYVSIDKQTDPLIEGAGDGVISWGDVQSKPSTFAPSAHTHTKANITDFTHTHAKADITDFSHTHNYADILDAPADTTAITLEPTGFDKNDLVTLTYDVDTRKVVLGGSGWKAYWRGQEVTELIPGWESTAHPTDYGAYYVYWDDEGLIISTTPWNFDKLQIAFISYQATYSFALRETHGLLQWQTHRHLHATIGTYVRSGFDASAYVLNSTTAADRRVSISEGTVMDEDLPSVVPQLLKTDNAGSPYAWFSLTGANTPVLEQYKSEIINTNVGVLRYNLFSTTWGQSDITNNSYGKIFVIALPMDASPSSQSYRYLFIQPQQISGSLNTIQAVAFSSVNFGTFSTTVPEFVPIAEIIVRQQVSGWTLISVNKITGARQLLTSAATGITAVTTDATLTGSGTAGAPLAVASNLIPYYFPRWTFAGTYAYPSLPLVSNGGFWYDPTLKELLIPYVDADARTHETELKKLDYSSVIYIYNADKTKKNKYVFTQSDIVTSANYILIQCDSFTNNLNEEFTLTATELYSMEFIFCALQDLTDLRTINISDPVNDQVLAYSSGSWINKTISTTGKAALSVGWFNDLADGNVSSADYYFSSSTLGAVWNLVGTDFSILQSSNITGILQEQVGTNKCGVRNVSGVTKQFLVLAKCLGLPTATTWVTFGLLTDNTNGNTHIRPSRVVVYTPQTESTAIEFHCVVSMAHNSDVYLAGSCHSTGQFLKLINIVLTVIEL